MQDDLKNCPKISIITVSYNSAKTIEQTILSVINQSYKNIEYIIIDGGSTDGTVDIIKKYADKIAYWVSEPDEGIYNAMNKGVDIASGEYIYFLGSDDWLYEQGIIKNISLKLVNSDIAILSCNVLSVDEQIKIEKLYKNTVSGNIIKDLNTGYSIPHQGLFVKSTIFANNKFDESYVLAGDYDFTLKIIRQYKITTCDEIIAFYSTGGASSSLLKAYKEHIALLNKYGNKDTGYLKNEVILLFKEKIRKLLYKVGLWKYIQINRGWSKHNCYQKKCKWYKTVDR